MEIKAIYPESAGKKLRYDLTCKPTNQRLSTCEGQVLEVAAWCHFTDVNQKTGELQELLSIQTPEGEVYTSNSATVLGEFLLMVDMFGPDGVDAVEVQSGTSKAGRKFFTLVYAGSDN